MYRFAFDLGSGSIGWAVFRLSEDGASPVDLCDMGVRIFPTGRDPKSKASNAVGRRLPRQMRRQVDRRKKRRREVEEKLVDAGLMPPKSQHEERKNFFGNDPYCARRRAAAGPTCLYDLGRAIWHISKHRGFKSNRKADRANTNEEQTGKIASGIKSLNDTLNVSGAKATYGAWLASRHLHGQTVRIRAIDTDADSKVFDFFPERRMLEEEFDCVWDEQAKRHNTLTSELKQSIRDSVFFQRPLKPVPPGQCTFFPNEPRLSKWHPLAQEFRILQQLNNLKILDGDSERHLTLAERNLIADHLMKGYKLTFHKLRKMLGLSSNAEFNLGRGQEKDLLYNETSARLVGNDKKPGPLHNVWHNWDSSRQIALLELLDRNQSPSETVESLMNKFGLTDDVADEVEMISLPEGHLHICKQAASAIVKVFRENVMVYSKAVAEASKLGYFPDNANLHHSGLRPDNDPCLPCLPPYNRVESLRHMIGFGSGDLNDPPDKRYGRISNPTVHVALGQFRRVMNKLISRYGKPSQIVIETTRDLPKSAVELHEHETYIRFNRKRNEAWRTELEEARILKPGERVGDRFLRMRLWEELGKNCASRQCPYSGRIICRKDLHSNKVEIDHILPFAETFDDGIANKTVCFRDVNRIKGKRAPADAWQGDDLTEIVDRVRSAPGMKRKLWRFLPNALENWREQRSFEKRQLHATGHLARVVRKYVEVLFPKNETSKIWMPSGYLTAMMRQRWGLFLPGHNTKYRDDHRHHAIDAAVVGVIDLGTIRMLHTYAHKVGASGIDRVLPDPPMSIPNFRKMVLAKVESIMVSHRPDHSPTGRLHEDTAYGPIREFPENQDDLEIGNLVVRKPVASLTKGEIERIRDNEIRSALMTETEDVVGNNKLLKSRLLEWSKNSGHKRLRIIVSDDSARAIFGEDGKPNARMPYKMMIPGDVLCLDILEDENGKWVSHTVLRWVAVKGIEHDHSLQSTRPNMKFIMRLYKGDTIQLLDKETNCNSVKIVRRLEPSANRVRLAHINEAGDLNKRHDSKDDIFRWDFAGINFLKDRRARRVRIDELGCIRSVPHGKV